MHHQIVYIDVPCYSQQFINPLVLKQIRIPYGRWKAELLFFQPVSTMIRFMFTI